jgi:putative restriction endonuclease
VNASDDLDNRVRTAAFDWLADQVLRQGDVLPRDVLAAGFSLNGERVPLLGPQGIFKPRIMKTTPLSITTIPGGPYDDRFTGEDLLHYRYRGTDPHHPDNVGLRTAMNSRVPLVYFHRIVPSKYVAAWPVFIVADDPNRLVFTVAVDDLEHLYPIGMGEPQVKEREDARRVYITAVTRIRVHQRAFRERVLEAYRRQCAFCHFRHEELLDAAHIVPDAHPAGEPVVRNGLALCSLHHGAFDRYFLGVRPDYVIEVRPDVLVEKDGPTLIHGIQALHGRSLLVPREEQLKPDRELLAMRYEDFRKAC